jgi:hypothetical protein
VRVEESVKHLLIPFWRGYAPDLVVPPPNTAVDAKNFVLDEEIEGALTMRKGIANVYGTGPTPKDSHIQASKEYSAYIVESRRSNPELVAEEVFYVREQGGQWIHAVVMKYRFRQMATGQAYIYSYGLWVRPWWDGSAWQDYWVELSEFWDFQIYAVAGTNNEWLQVDDDPVIWRFGNTDNIVFPKETYGGYGTGSENEYYFRGWTIENLESAKQYKRFCRCLQQRCTATDGSGLGILELKIPDDGVNSAYDELGWAVNDKIRLHRNYVYMANRFSASDDIVTDPRFFFLDDGMRMSNGLGTNKARFRIGYEEHPWNANFPKEHIANGLILSDQFIEPFPPALFVSYDPATSPAASTTLGAGTYKLRFSIREGKNWSKLYVCPRYDSANSRYDATDDAGIVLLAGDKIPVVLQLYTAVVSRKATAVRIYLEDPGTGTFYLSKEIDLTSLTTASTDDYFVLPYYDGTNTWYVYGIQESIDLTEMTGSEATNLLGRAITDDGVCFWNAAAPAGFKVLYGDVEISESRYGNRVHVSPSGGDGQVQTDIVAKDATNYVDLVRGDASTIRAMTAFDDRALILTERSMMLLTLRGAKANWAWEVITVDDGIASLNSLVNVDRRAYWAGSYGVWSFSLAQGRRLLSAGFQSTYKGLSNKETSMAGFDAQNGRYCLYVDGKWYFFPTRVTQVGLGENLPTIFNKTPVWVGKPPAPTLSFVTSDTLLVRSYTATRDYGSANIECEYKTNPVRSPDKFRVLMLVEGFRLEYISSVAITVELYLDGSASAFSSKTCPAAETEHSEFFDLSAACKSFQVKIKTITTADSQSVTIKALTVARDLMPAGGVAP